MSVEGPPHLVTGPGADPAEATDRIVAGSAGGHHRRPGSPGGDGALTVRTGMEPLGELTISTHGRGELVSGSVKVVSNGPLESVLDSPAFLSHWGNTEAYLDQNVYKEKGPREFTTNLFEPSADSSVRRRKVQPAFRQEQRTTLGDWINSTGVVCYRSPATIRRPPLRLISVEPSVGFPKKSCRRALPLILDPLPSYRSRNGESLKLRVTVSRGVLPL